jgi:hypothetical protein
LLHRTLSLTEAAAARCGVEMEVQATEDMQVMADPLHLQLALLEIVWAQLKNLQGTRGSKLELTAVIEGPHVCFCANATALDFSSERAEPGGDKGAVVSEGLFSTVINRLGSKIHCARTASSERFEFSIPMAAAREEEGTQS